MNACLEPTRRELSRRTVTVALDSYAGTTPIRFSGFHIDVVSASTFVCGAPTSLRSVGASATAWKDKALRHSQEG
jgi:hypothetical protein